MLDLSRPWWEFIVRASAVYVFLMAMVRLSGKRAIGQFTPFDLLVVMLLSEAVSNALSGGDDSLVGGLIGATTLIVLNGLAGFAGSHSRRVEAWLEGEPVLIARDGKPLEAVMRRHRLGALDLEKALREEDCELDAVKCAFLETDGSISIIKKK